MTAAATGAAVIGISVSSADSSPASSGSSVAATANIADTARTTTPIKHLVVLFDENISFDHYFGTYPYAENKPGEPQFTANPNTPTVNGLNNTLLEANPNSAEPQRLGPDQALTCDQNHGYAAEQSAYDDGLMDKFVQDTTGKNCSQTNEPNSPSGNYGPNGVVMDYYDGNTVTGLWNYAQHYSLNDNSYSDQFGPSTPGALNVIAGNTHGAQSVGGTSPTGAIANATMEGDVDPTYDDCSNKSGATGTMTGKNIGDELNSANLTWGWFQGGFTPTTAATSTTSAVCGAYHYNIGGAKDTDYSPHHEPFQYYASTSNPHHLAPANNAQIGTSMPAGVNHQYDLTSFNTAVDNGEMPAVSYLKAPEYEDGHAGYSDPLDEQRFLVSEINRIEQSPQWASTAVVIAYDDSDGWYDHQEGSLIRGSRDALDTLNGTGKCGPTPSPDGTTADRCGVGPRMPLLVISPWAKQNYVDNTFTQQSSIPRFIEDNWGLPRIGEGSNDASAGTLNSMFEFNQPGGYGHAPAVILDPATGEVVNSIPARTSSSSGSSTSTTTTTSTTTMGGGTTGTGSAGSGHGRTGSGKKVTIIKIVLPKLTFTVKSSARAIKVAARTRGGSKVATMVRMRLSRGQAMIANQAATVRNHRAAFTVKRGSEVRSGKYKVTMTVDAAGKVGAVNRTVSIR